MTDQKRPGQRVTKHATFFGIAKLWQQRSTCAKHRVGCIVVKDGRTLCSGYNGVPANDRHCYDVWAEHAERNGMEWDQYVKSADFRAAHRLWSRSHEVHAEANAIAFAALNGIALRNTVMYCTLCPCPDCAKLLARAGIRAVYFLGPAKYPEALRFLRDHGVGVFQTTT